MWRVLVIEVAVRVVEASEALGGVGSKEGGSRERALRRVARTSLAFVRRAPIEGWTRWDTFFATRIGVRKRKTDEL
jgi:hypothetical protein